MKLQKPTPENWNRFVRYWFTGCGSALLAPELMTPPRTSEAAFETVIESHLLANGYTRIAEAGFDRARAIFPETILNFHPRDAGKGMEKTRSLARRKDRRANPRRSLQMDGCPRLAGHVAPRVAARGSALAVAMAKMLQTLEAQLARYRALITECFKQHPDHTLFTSLPGAGPSWLRDCWANLSR